MSTNNPASPPVSRTAAADRPAPVLNSDVLPSDGIEEGTGAGKRRANEKFSIGDFLEERDEFLQLLKDVLADCQNINTDSCLSLAIGKRVKRAIARTEGRS